MTRTRSRSKSIQMMLIIRAAIPIMLKLSMSFELLLNETKKNRLSLTLRKLAAFECGIEPLGDYSNKKRMKFEILYYLVGLLYLILDLEIVLLFPLVVRLFTLPPLAFLVVLIFIILLTLGFLYEWLIGALNIIARVLGIGIIRYLAEGIIDYY